MNKNNFEDEEFPHELFLTTRQTTKINSIGQIFWSAVRKFRKKTLTDLAIPFARDNLPGLVSSLASNEINKFQRKISGKGAVRAGKGFTLFISNADMNDII